jgi:hypothetical protein
VQGVKTPCAFNQTGFSNFFQSLKNRTAGQKDFFDTLKKEVLQIMQDFLFYPGLLQGFWESLSGTSAWSRQRR